MSYAHKLNSVILSRISMRSRTRDRTPTHAMVWGEFLRNYNGGRPKVSPLILTDKSKMK